MKLMMHNLKQRLWPPQKVQRGTLEQAHIVAHHAQALCDADVLEAVHKALSLLAALPKPALQTLGLSCSLQQRCDRKCITMTGGRLLDDFHAKAPLTVSMTVSATLVIRTIRLHLPSSAKRTSTVLAEGPSPKV